MGTAPQPAKGPTIVTITNGLPDENPARVNRRNTLQFVNQDNTDYRIWGLRVARYLGTDILLPARGSVSLFVDDATQTGQSSYELFPINLRNRALLANRGAVDAGAVTEDDSGGGGQIVVDP